MPVKIKLRLSTRGLGVARLCRSWRESQVRVKKQVYQAFSKHYDYMLALCCAVVILGLESELVSSG